MNSDLKDIEEKVDLPSSGDGYLNNRSTSLDEHNVDELLHNTKKWYNWRFVWQYCCISLAWVLFGYDVAFVSGLLGLPLFIQKFQGPNEAGLLIFNARSLNLIIPLSVAGTACAPFIFPYLQKTLGRKYTLVFAYAVFCVPASFLQLFAPNMGALAAGRFLNYCGVGLCINTVPIYVTESVPARYRAMLTGWSGAFNLLIGVFTTIIMYECAKLTSSLQYKIPLSIQAGLPIILMGLTLTLVESPGWLISKGRVEEARRNHALLRRKDCQALVDAEIATMIAGFEDQERKAKPRFREIFLNGNFKRTIASSLVGCLTACSGYSLSATYGVVILISAGLSDPYKWQIFAAVLALVGNIIGSFAYDKIGRRPLLIYGLLAVATFDFIAGAIATTGYKTSSQSKALASVSIILSFVVNVVFASNYTLSAEVPNIALREVTAAYCGFTNNVATLIQYFVVPYLLTSPGNLGAKTYLIFGGFMVIGSVAIFFLMPETKGRTWAEIDELYESGVPYWKWKNTQTSSAARVTALTQQTERQPIV